MLTPALATLALAAAPADLAARIDGRLAGAFRAAGVVPAPAADDAEFLRRVTLDVVGRIPSVAEARAFLDDPAADKRERLVEALLDGPGYAAHTAKVWRAALAPQATANPQTQYLGVSLEAWLRDRYRAGLRDGEVARELLTARLDYLDWTPDRKASPAPGLSPVGFYQANDLKPETVAAAVGRTFLGLRIECAQCHDHPFDKWTQRQAWETAAFFAGVAPLGPEVKPAALLANRRELEVAETKSRASARFLDGTEPDWAALPDPRRAFADWLTKAGNPYFARVAANRVWAEFFGVGLVDPVDDWGPHNPPSHPELLDELADAYAASGFDRKFLVRAVTRSEAYRRTSRKTHPSQAEARAFARMNVKGLSAEQLFDSLALATGYRDPVPLAAQAVHGWPADSPRGQFVSKFGGGAGRTDMQVSILQALSLMNGDWTTGQAAGETVRAVAASPFFSDGRRVETLFLAALARRPTAAERERYLAHVAGAEGRAGALADVMWALVNGHEFLVNR